MTPHRRSLSSLNSEALHTYFTRSRHKRPAEWQCIFVEHFCRQWRRTFRDHIRHVCSCAFDAKGQAWIFLSDGTTSIVCCFVQRRERVLTSDPVVVLESYSRLCWLFVWFSLFDRDEKRVRLWRIINYAARGRRCVALGAECIANRFLNWSRRIKCPSKSPAYLGSLENRVRAHQVKRPHIKSDSCLYTYKYTSHTIWYMCPYQILKFVFYS